MSHAPRFFSDHTHLFPGARLRSDVPPPPGNLAKIRVCFSDGTEVDASLKEELDGLGMEVSLGGYTTATGTDINARRWHVKSAQVTPQGGAILVLGSRLN